MRGRVTHEHLQRTAFVYVRQSSDVQVMEHGESTARQYALVERAVQLGWEREAVQIIDEDLGRSGASTQGRSGFARLAVRKVLIDGEIRHKRDRGRDPERWQVRLPDAHPGYISWERYVSNQRKLEHNRGRFGGSTVTQGPRRQLMLSGIVMCGRCGRRMHARYRGKRTGGGMYLCEGDCNKGQARCWSVLGEPIDRAVEALFLKTVVADEVELGLAVDRQVDKQAEALAQQWRLRIEKASYEARRAERRYKAVDPDNRVVARTLERDWEERLHELAQIERDYERARSEARVHLTEQDRARIRELSGDLKQLWNAPTTQQADRKAMLALVMEVIALNPVDVPRRSTRVRVQWKAGAIDELLVNRTTAGERRKPAPNTLARLRQLVSQRKHDAEVAVELNAEGYRTGDGLNWTQRSVSHARRVAQIERAAPNLPRGVQAPARLPDGSWSIPAVAQRYGVSRDIVRNWVTKGLVSATRNAFEKKPNMLWLTIDEQTDARLRAIVSRRTRAYPKT